MNEELSPSSVIQALDGLKLAEDLALHVKISSVSPVQVHFSLFLAKPPGHVVSTSEVFWGFMVYGDDGASSIDGHYFEKVSFPNGVASLGENGTGVRLFAILGNLISNGGSVTIIYSDLDQGDGVYDRTYQATLREYPVIVTPLGGLLYAAGCGVRLKQTSSTPNDRDRLWRIQGYKPVNAEEKRRAGVALIRELHQFLARRIEDDEVARQCRRRAFALIEQARET